MTNLIKTTAIMIAATGALAMQAYADEPCAIDEAAVYFEQGADNVTPASQEVIDKFSANLRECAVHQVVVQPPAGDLSQTRAVAVVKALEGQGVRATIAPAAQMNFAQRTPSVMTRATRIVAISEMASLS